MFFALTYTFVVFLDQIFNKNQYLTFNTSIKSFFQGYKMNKTLKFQKNMKTTPMDINLPF
jgi:hypothetical protein